MTLEQYSTEVMRGLDSHFSVWTGPEGKMMEIYLGVLSKKHGMEVKRVDTVQEIMTKINSKKMLDSKGKIYVVRDDSDVWDDEGFATKIDLMLSRDMLILIYTNMDKRKKFYKDSDPVEFEYLSEEVLTGYLVDSLSAEHSKRLVKMCQRDYGRILLEMDKVQTYAQARSLTNDEAFVELVKCGMIYAPAGDVIFLFSSAVLSRSKENSYLFLGQLYEREEAVVKILSVLYTNFRNLLVVQGDKGGTGVTERTGLTPWQISLAQTFKGIWTTARLKKNLMILQECESGIKTGKYSDRMAMEVAMVGVLG